MRTAKTLIRLGGYLGWSESSLGAHAILLIFSHKAAHSNSMFDLTNLGHPIKP